MCYNCIAGSYIVYDLKTLSKHFYLVNDVFYLVDDVFLIHFNAVIKSVHG